MTSTTNNLFTRDSILRLSEADAAKVLPDMEAEVAGDLATDEDRVYITTRKAAYMARTAMQAGILKAGSGGKRGPNVITGEEYGARFGKKYRGGKAIKQSTVSLWLRLGILATDVKGFSWDTKSHVDLFKRMTAEGFPTEVTKVMTGDKPTIGKVQAALKAVDQAKKDKASASSSDAPATGSDTSDGNKDDQGNDAPVAPTQSSLERALGALALIQHVMPDLKGRDFQRFDRAFGKVTEEVAAARDALAAMEAETEAAPERAANRGTAKKTA